MILHFLYAMLATAGFCLLFNVPRRHMLSASTVGAIGWVVFKWCVISGIGNVPSCFYASCAVALASDICSRLFKDASTLFVIPGILPLVPGVGMYNTLLAFLEGDFKKTSHLGSETLLMAGGIAVALLVVASVLKVLVTIKRKLCSLYSK